MKRRREEEKKRRRFSTRWSFTSRCWFLTKVNMPQNAVKPPLNLW